MQLKVYLAIKNETLKDFSKTIEVDHRYMSQIMNGRKKPGKRLAKDVELATGGVVRLLDHSESPTLEMYSQLDQKAM